MGIFGNAPVEQNLSQRQILEGKYNSSRSNILLVVVFTAINIILLAANGNTYFLFSAYVPYILVDLAMLLCGKYPSEFYVDGYAGMEFLDGSLFTVALIAAAIMVGLYLLCWIFSKKNRVGWIIAALVFFVIDTLGMLLLSGISLDNIIDIVFHGWVIVSLVSAIVTHGKLKKLPEDETELVDQPQNTSPEF